jgi:hypothetical protein
VFAIFVLQKLIESGNIAPLHDFDPVSLDTSLVNHFDFKNYCQTFKSKKQSSTKKNISNIKNNDLDSDPIHHIVEQYYANPENLHTNTLNDDGPVNPDDGDSNINENIHTNTPILENRKPKRTYKKKEKTTEKTTEVKEESVVAEVPSPPLPSDNLEETAPVVAKPKKTYKKKEKATENTTEVKEESVVAEVPSPPLPSDNLEETAPIVAKPKKTHKKKEKATEVKEPVVAEVPSPPLPSDNLEETAPVVAKPKKTQKKKEVKKSTDTTTSSQDEVKNTVIENM